LVGGVSSAGGACVLFASVQHSVVHWYCLAVFEG
jgi:hypothetical protein